MNKWKKLYQKTARRVVNLVTGNGLMQEENNVKVHGCEVPGMAQVIRACAAEGIVLLKNEKATLPLTAYKRVKWIITELAVIEATPEGLVLREVHEESSVEEVVSKTEAALIIPETVGTFR